LPGGDGSWDYVVPDPPHHRVFIARQNRVMVADQDSGKLLGEVTGIQGAHGTAVTESSGHGFATSGNDQSVVMFDLKTFQSLGRIPAAENADAILYDAPSNRVFTLNGDAHSSTVIDPKAGKAITRWEASRSSDESPDFHGSGEVWGSAGSGQGEAAGIAGDLQCAGDRTGGWRALSVSGEESYSTTPLVAIPKSQRGSRPPGGSGSSR